MKEKTEVTIMCDEFITQSELDSRMRDANADSVDEFMERIDCVYMTGATRNGVEGYALFF